MELYNGEDLNEYIDKVHESCEGRYELSGYDLNVIESALHQLSDYRLIDIKDKKPTESDNLILVYSNNGFSEIVWISDKDSCTNKPFAFDEYDKPTISYNNISYWMQLPELQK